LNSFTDIHSILGVRVGSGRGLPPRMGGGLDFGLSPHMGGGFSGCGRPPRMGGGLGFGLSPHMGGGLGGCGRPPRMGGGLDFDLPPHMGGGLGGCGLGFVLLGSCGPEVVGQSCFFPILTCRPSASFHACLFFLVGFQVLVFRGPLRLPTFSHFPVLAFPLG
jgi:hypothetical protein